MHATWRDTGQAVHVRAPTWLLESVRAAVRRQPFGAEYPVTDREVVQQTDDVVPRSPVSRETDRPFRSVCFVCGVYVISRAAVLLAAQVPVWLHRGSVYLSLTSWDSGYYGALATHGYGSGPVTFSTRRWAFFPAWPTLLRIAHWTVGGSWQRNGIALAFLLGLGAAIAIWFAVAAVMGPVAADRTAVIFAFLPGSVALSMPYTESMFAACGALCLYALRRRWWIVAGCSAAVAGATRFPGVVLTVCCAIAAVAAVRQQRSWRPLVAPLLAPLGLVAFLVKQRQATGTPFAFLQAQRFWGGSVLGIASTVRHVLFSRTRFAAPLPLFIVVAVVILLVGVVAMAFRNDVPTIWWVYTLGLAAMSASVHSGLSLPRYVLPVFPAYACLAARLSVRAYAAFVATCAALMVLSAILIFTVSPVRFAP